jgi:hypothetical protein
MNKIDEVFSMVRTNLNTDEIKKLVTMLRTEVSASVKVGLKEVRVNNISESGYPVINGITIDEWEMSDLINNDKGIE